MEKNLFEIATREHYRFPWHGLISIEDLWSLPQEELDIVYKTLQTQRQEHEGGGLIESKETNAKTATIENKMEIVRHVFNFKEDLKKHKEQEKEKAEKKHRILELMAKKQDDALADKSIEELEAMLKEL